ncbi:MAG: hypothetical protein WD749_06035 [Phycisphaerales bacterium]
MVWGSRIGVGLLVFAIGMGVLFYRRGEAGESYREAAREMIREVQGYSARAEYYDYLVDAAHDQVFNDATEIQPGGRRGRGKVVIDEEKYIRTLFDEMIRMANDERATGVADALAKYRLEHIVSETPAPTPPAGVKAATGGRVDEHGRKMRW